MFGRSLTPPDADAPPAVVSMQTGAEGTASAPDRGHMAEEGAKIKSALHFAAALAYQPARQEDPHARFHLSGAG